ncbi:helix-turn-helix domain-containing protein [Solibacillus ferritrahens]|uniref:helix-turn-helix domain-containing protein n=1 Tax=Solibacillus ferritrahens TaxID=3098620 RepID=UPI0030083C35
MFDYAHSENTQAYLEHIMAEEKHKIKDFYVLFISDYNIGKKNYSLFFDRHIMDESIVYVEQDEGSINAPSYIVDGDEYAKNEELFYKIRLQSRKRTIEKMAISINFYMVAHNTQESNAILNNDELLENSIEKTKVIIQNETFLGKEETWDNFYVWIRNQLKTLILEEMFLINGIRGIKELSGEELNVTFFELLRFNLSINKSFIRKFSNLVDLYLKEWQRRLINELNNNISAYLQIESVIEQSKTVAENNEAPQLKFISNYAYVLNNVAYHVVREAIYKQNFKIDKEVMWPKYSFVKGNTNGNIQIIPLINDRQDINSAYDNNQQNASNIAQQMSLMDVDVLDILCHLYLQLAKNTEDIVEIELRDILIMRGLRAKLGGDGRRGGFEAKQKEQVINSLKVIQSLWLTIDKTVMYKNNKPIQVEVQGRTFLFKNAMGEEYEVNEETCSKSFTFTVDKVFAKYLTSSKRQMALLPLKAMQYHAARFHLEKKLCRYLSWRWRTQAYKGDYQQLNRVNTLLDACGEEVNDRLPVRTRERLERALDKLAEDKIIADWYYVNWDENIAQGKGWLKYWLNTAIMIDPVHEVKEHYRSIERVKKPVKSITASNDMQTSYQAELVQRIHEVRISQNLTLTSVAEEIEISASYLNKIERGLVAGSPKIQKKILNWLERFD